MSRHRQAYFIEAILQARGVFYLAFRLLIRLGEALATRGEAGTTGVTWYWIALLFALGDLVSWRIIRGNTNFGLAWRLPVDAADMVFWGLSPLSLATHSEIAALIGVPLAMESGFRVGPRGVAVALALVGASLIVGTTGPNADGPLVVLWLLGGSLLGLLLKRYCQTLYDKAARDDQQSGEAERGRAYLAGQNAVAMGASSIVDAIEGVIPVIGRPPPGSALWRLGAGWKGLLAQSTQRHVTYLQVALLDWERRHNQSPDLSQYVVVALDEGLGTTMLTGFQVEHFHEALNEMHLRGHVAISRGDSNSDLMPPGAPLTLRVGPRLVDLPPDPGQRLRPVDPAAAAFGLGAMQCWAIAAGHADGPAAILLVLGLLFLGGAWWSHSALLRRGSVARQGILCLAVALATVNAIVITLVHAPIGIAAGLTAIAILGGLYWYDVSPMTRVSVVGVALATSALALLASNRSYRGDTIAAILVVALTVFPTCRYMGASLVAAAIRHAQQTADERDASIRDSFQRGQASVMRLVSEARDEAYNQLKDVHLDDGLALVARQRLAEIDRRLARTGAEQEDSSSRYGTAQ